MRSLKDAVSFRILKLLINIVWGFAVIIFPVAVIILLIASIFGSDDILESSVLETNIYLGGDTPHIQLESSNPNYEEIEFEIVSGIIRFKVVNMKIWLFMISTIIISLILFLYILYIIKSIIDKIGSNHPFSLVNIKKIRFIGYAIIISEVIKDILFLIFRYNITDITYNGEPIVFAYEFNIMTVFYGLMILVIAEIIKIGAEMKLEQDLTI